MKYLKFIEDIAKDLAFDWAVQFVVTSILGLSQVWLFVLFFIYAAIRLNLLKTNPKYS